VFRLPPVLARSGIDRSQLAARANVVIVLADRTSPRSELPAIGEHPDGHISRGGSAASGQRSSRTSSSPTDRTQSRGGAGRIERVDELCVAIERSVDSQNDSDSHRSAAPPDLGARFRRNNRVAAIDLAGETVLFDARSGRAHRLNPAAAEIWEALDGSVSLADLVTGFAQRFDIDPTMMHNDVIETVAALRHLGAIQLWHGYETSVTGSGSGPVSRSTCRQNVCGRTTLLRLGSYPRLVIAAGDHVLSIHCNDAAVRARIASLLASRMVADDIEPVNFAIELPTPGDATVDVPSLYRGPDVIATSPSAESLVADLVRQLATFTTPVVGTLLLDADVWVEDAAATLRIPSALTVTTELADPAGAGAFVAPVLVDVASGELVVERDHLFSRRGPDGRLVGGAVSDSGVGGRWPSNGEGRRNGRADRSHPPPRPILQSTARLSRRRDRRRGGPVGVSWAVCPRPWVAPKSPAPYNSLRAGREGGNSWAAVAAKTEPARSTRRSPRAA